MPSQPLDPQLTGTSPDDIMSAAKGEEGITIENDLYVPLHLYHRCS